MSRAQTQSRDVTLALLAEIAETDPAKIRGDQKLREDLGLDSLQSLELLSCVGEKLKIDLDIDKAMDIRTVDDACAFVAREYGEQSPDGCLHA
jgi:acyl carrier protein